MTTRILIADDNEIARDILKELIQNYDHWEVCAEAENGQQAVLKATELKPDIIVLDLAMPVMDGLTAAGEIGKILPSVPIVLYTLHAFPSMELEAKKVGVRQVVSKPDTDALLSVIKKLLREASQETSQDRTAQVAAASGPLSVTSRFAVQPQPTGSSTTDPGDSDTSIKSN